MERLTVSVIALLALSTLASAEPPCHMQEIFSCIDKAVDYLNSLPKRSLPQSSDDVERLCGTMNDTISCLDNYRKRCMTPIQTELVNLATEGIFDLRNRFCGSGSAVKSDYLKHAECLNKVSQSDVIFNNLQYFLGVTEHLLTLPMVERLNFVCCGYAKMYQTIRSESLNTCGEDATKVGEELISLVIAQLPNMLCTGYDGDSEECTSVLPPEGTRPSNEFKENSIYKFFNEMLKNFLEE